MKREKIIFLSAKNPFTTKDWSGIPFFLFRSLSTSFDVEYVSLPTFSAVRKMGYYASKLFLKLSGKQYVFDYGIVMALLYGIIGSLRLRKQTNIKFIFSPAGLTEIAFLRTSIPIVTYGDCSTLQLINYYPALRNVSKLSIKEIDFVERNAFKRASHAVFSSNWASDFVQLKFGKSCSTIPFGSNILDPTLTHLPKNISQTVCSLLFVGVDWKRKGADVALKIHQALLILGIPSRLTLVGLSIPREETTPAFITVFPHIDKDSEEGAVQINKIFTEALFFILPTRADCTPIVISEALSFGIPVLATNTGGIASQVEHGKTGFLFSEDDVEGYAQVIADLFNEKSYQQLSANCLEAYQKTFNWNSWVHNLQFTILAQTS